VFKELVNKEKEPYKAWLKLDTVEEKDKNNNYKIKQFSEGFGYDLEKSLSRFPIKELIDPEQKEALIKSLQKGNQQQITIDQDGKPVKFYLEASPQYKTVNAYNEQQKSIKRETIMKPEGKAAKQEQKNDQSEEQKSERKRSRKQGV